MREPELASPGAAAPDAIDARVRAEQVQVIYEQSPPALLISVLVGALLCFLLRDVTDHILLAGWLTTLVVLALSRLGIVLRYRSRTPEAADMPRWERRFLVSLTLTGLAWGIGGWLIMPAESVVHQAVVYFFLLGMAGGAVASYSAHALCTSITIVCVMAPATAWLLVQDDALHRAMAVGGIIFVGTAYRATRNLGYFLRRSFQLSYLLEAANAAAERLARTDELTGMRNRRAFHELGEVEFAQFRRYGRPLALVMIDIDHFKAINDTWGHAMGDRALQALAAVIGKTARGTDVTGRIGGEEFAVLLPESMLAEAAKQAERLRSQVASHPIDHEGTPIQITCSLGVAECDRDVASFDVLVARADAALYQAKDDGRNRVVCHRSSHPLTP